MPLKKSLIIIAIVVAVFVSGLTAATWFVHSERFQQWVVGKVNQIIDGRIAVDEMDLSLLQGRINVSGVRLFGADDLLLAAVQDVELSISWAALIKRELAVTRLKVDGVNLELIFDDQDQLTIATALTGPASQSDGPQKTAPSWHVRVDIFVLNNGFVHVHRPSVELEGRLGPVAVEGNLDSAGGRGRLAVAIDELALQWAGLDQTIQDLALEVAYLDADAKPWQVAVKTPGSRLSARGQVHWKEQDPGIDAVGEVDLNLAEVQPWLAMDLGLQGRLKCSLQLKGLLSDPQAGLELKLDKATIRGIKVEELSAKAVLDQRRITLDKLTGHGSWGRIDVNGKLDLQAVFAKSLFEKTDSIEALSYAVSMAVENLQPWRVSGLPGAWIGTWQGRARLQGQGLPGLGIHRGQGQVDLGVSQFRLSPGGRPVDGTFAAEGQWDQAQLDILNCRASLPAHVLEARGRLDWQPLALEATGQLTSDRMDALGDALGIDLPQGHAIVKLAASGPLTRPMVTADMLAQDLEMKGLRLGRALVSAALDSQLNLTVSRLVLENQGSYLEGRGHMALAREDPGLKLDLDFDQLDPADFSASLPARAFLNGRLNISGTINNPLGQLTLDPSPIQWGNYQATAQGSAGWREGRLHVAGLQLAHEDSKIEIQGHLDFKNPQSGRWRTDPWVDLKAHSDRVLLENFWPDGRGRLSTLLALQGPLSNPTGEFALDGHQLDLNVQQFSQVHLAGRLRDRVVYVDDLSIGLAADQMIQGDGRFALDQTFDFQFKGRDLALDHIKSIQGAYPVSGRLDLIVQGSGSIQDPLIRADVAVRDPLFDNRPFDDFQLQANLQGRRLTVEGKMNFDFKADCDLSSGEFALDARFDDTDLSPWIALVADGWQAVLSGQVAAAGNWHVWHAMRVEVNLSRGELFFGGRRLLAIPELSLDFKDGRVQLPDTRLVILDEGYLTLMAAGDLTEHLTVKADGRLPVSALAPFLKGSEEVSGQVLLTVDAQGPWDHLQWRLDADLDQVSYVIPYLSQSVQGLSGKVQMTPDQVTLSGLSGRIEDGLFTIYGQVKLSGLQPVQGAVTLKLDNLPLQVPGTMDAKVNGELVLKGAPDQARMEGRLILLEGLYYKNLRMNLLSMISQTRRTPTVSRVSDRPQWLQNISFDVALTHRYPFLVDNNLAYLEIIPDLRLTGTAANPIINGRATVSEGEVRFRGKAFPVTRGVVDFLNPTKIEPSLDILSETQIRKWLVSLSISGTPDQLVVALDSNPPETENDILSLILFGRTNAEITSGQGAGKATTQQMMAGLLASALGEDIKKTTGVDILEVDTGGPEEEDSADRIQVTVGKQLSSRITVKYIMESSGGESVQRAVSEYRFMEHILASGFQDSKGRYGGELLFRIEF